MKGKITILVLLLPVLGVAQSLQPLWTLEYADSNGMIPISTTLGGNTGVQQYNHPDSLTVSNPTTGTETDLSTALSDINTAIGNVTTIYTGNGTLTNTDRLIQFIDNSTMQFEFGTSLFGYLGEGLVLNETGFATTGNMGLRLQSNGADQLMLLLDPAGNIIESQSNDLNIRTTTSGSVTILSAGSMTHSSSSDLNLNATNYYAQTIRKRPVAPALLVYDTITNEITAIDSLDLLAGDTNFANTDLTLDADRSHDGGGFDLGLSNVDRLDWFMNDGSFKSSVGTSFAFLFNDFGGKGNFTFQADEFQIEADEGNDTQAGELRIQESRDEGISYVGLTVNDTLAASYSMELPDTIGAADEILAVFSGNKLYWKVDATTSDRRMKEKIRPLQYGISDLMKLRPVEFNMVRGGRKNIGFIAQEVEAAGITEPVEVRNDRYYLFYEQLTAVSVKAIQEQQDIIESQENRIRVLEKKLQEKDTRVRAIERKLEQIAKTLR